MGEVVSFPTALIDDADFVLALARYADGLLTEAAIKKKYRFDDETWNRLGENEALIAKIEALKEQRIRSGATAREKAQSIFTRAPDVLAAVMDDPSQSARHRIDAAREIRAVSANGPEAAPAADRFIIEINLGGDVLKFDKSIAIDANDVDPNDTNTTMLPIIAANKRDGGDGEPV
jgi:hypothetical protein